MHCPHCLYDLSHTQLPRCPECGRAFDRAKPDTFLHSGTRWAAFEYHFSRFVRNGVDGLFGGDRMFCRECFASLQGAVNEKCPTCGKWFKRNDRSTYRKSDDALVRLFYRFESVSFGRGLLIPLMLLIYAAYCMTTRTSFLPAGRFKLALFEWAWMNLSGPTSIGLGLGWIGIAIALHCRYFWGRVEPIWRFADLGVIVGLLMLAAGWFSTVAWAILETLH